MWGYVASIDNLFWGPLVWDSRATAKRLITEGRLPVPGDNELGTIKQLAAYAGLAPSPWRSITFSGS